MSLPPPLISCVSPVYGAPELIPELVSRLQKSIETIGLDYEIVLVDDCGPGDAWARIVAEATRDPRVRGLRLTRNQGQHQAIQVGLAYARGEWVAVLDCDLQDRPEDLPALWATAQATGADQVLARREQRPDSWVARLGSWGFYVVLGSLTGRRHDAAVANFGLYRRWLTTAVLAQPRRWPFFPLQARLAGGRVATVAVRPAARPSGASGYSLGRRLRLAGRVLASTVWPCPVHPQPAAYFVAETIPPTIAPA